MTESKKRMLFLDDRTKRIEAARKKYTQDYDVTFVHNAKECLRYLCKHRWEILSLDHDLNGDDFQDPDDVTSGMEVVRYIVKCGLPMNLTLPEMWVHSSNLFAANLMIKELRKVGANAYYRKFEYGDEIKFGDVKPSHKPAPVEDKWSKDPGKQLYGNCPSCGDFKLKDEALNQCYDCYKRELIQCG